jgi:hypothetical protein
MPVMIQTVTVFFRCGMVATLHDIPLDDAFGLLKLASVSSITLGEGGD